MDNIMRSAWLEIDLKNLVYNFKAIQEKVGNTDIIPIIKANAYGHGAVPLAKNSSLKEQDLLLLEL